jgi:hypothetical protein
MRPAVAEAEHILDIHSTSQDVVPFWVYPAFARNAAVARRAAAADVHLVMPAGLGSGTPLIQHGAHAGAEAPGCRARGRVRPALQAGDGRPRGRGGARFPRPLRPDRARGAAAATPPRRFELLRTHVIQHESFAFVRPVIGFETFAEGELIATDGPLEIRAPCDDCTIFMPARKAIVGREGVYLTKPLR